MSKDVVNSSERTTYSLPVDPDKDSMLIETLKYRGTFGDDETVFEPPTGKTDPTIKAISRTTGSLLEYANSVLNYTEGKNGAKADEHAMLFMQVTVDKNKQK